MDHECNELFDHGDLVTTLHCKQHLMLNKKDFEMLLECENIEDICAKIQIQYPDVIEMKSYTKNELCNKLFNTLSKEVDDGLEGLKTKKHAEFFLINYKIQSFFFLLSSKEHDCDLTRSFSKIEQLGYFIELDTLKFCNDLDDVILFCIRNCFLLEYYEETDFEKDFKDNDYSICGLKFKRRHIYKYYDEDDHEFESILKFEGDKINFDVVLSTLESGMAPEKRMELMCKISNFNDEDLYKLANSSSVEDMKMVLQKNYFYKKYIDSLQENDLSLILLKIEMKYFESIFSEFNNIISVYAFYKLREQEIKNIMWVAECVISGEKIPIETLTMPSNILN